MKLYYAIEQTWFSPSENYDELYLDSCWNTHNGILGVFEDPESAKEALSTIVENYRTRPSTICYSNGWNYARFAIDDWGISVEIKIIMIKTNTIYWQGLE